jgi:trans-aconitate 2-methyltransferase
MWDPSQYLRYADARGRPFFELLARVAGEEPSDVVDLGCGPGQLTRILAERWPRARVIGVDSSPEMVAEAQAWALPGRLGFEVADLTAWQPPGPLDLVVSHATLHWVPEHPELLGRFVSWLRPAGWLAFQVPANFAAPSHTLLAALRASPRWRTVLGAEDRGRTVLEPAEYVDPLARLGCRVDVWETTYQHVLHGDDAVLDWVKGTALRPVLAALDEIGRSEFLAEYGAALRTAYPPQGNGTVFAFRRIFVVAQKVGADEGGSPGK